MLQCLLANYSLHSTVLFINFPLSPFHPPITHYLFTSSTSSLTSHYTSSPILPLHALVTIPLHPFYLLTHQSLYLFTQQSLYLFTHQSLYLFTDSKPLHSLFNIPIHRLYTSSLTRHYTSSPTLTLHSLVTIPLHPLYLSLQTKMWTLTRMNQAVFCQLLLCNFSQKIIFCGFFFNSHVQGYKKVLVSW